MTNVNEEIVRQYLETKGFFVRTDVIVEKRKEQTGKKSSGYGDIDLLAEHPDGRRYLVEVKGWHTERIAPNYFRQEVFVDDLSRKKAKEVFQSTKFETVLVVPRIGIRRELVFRAARRQHIDMIWEFKNILKELTEHVKTNVSYDSEVLQTIRLLKLYQFIP